MRKLSVGKNKQNFANNILLHHVGPQNFYFLTPHYKIKMKQRSEEMQTLRAGCSKVEPKILPFHKPASKARRTAKNVISWRWSLPLLANPVW